MSPSLPANTTSLEAHAQTQEMLCRLFWLITNATGVARYADDVELFTRASMRLGITDSAQGEKLIAGYRKAERD